MTLKQLAQETLDLIETGMRQHQIENGKPMPFDSRPNAAFKICIQKTCT